MGQSGKTQGRAAESVTLADSSRFACSARFDIPLPVLPPTIAGNGFPDHIFAQKLLPKCGLTFDV
jgi:hypothetical protein